MNLISELIQNLRNIVSGFVKPKDITLPFEGINLPSERMGIKNQEKEPLTSEEVMNKADDFIRKAQQMLNSKNKGHNDGNPNQ